MAELNKETFEILRNSAEEFLEKLNIPEYDVRTEDDLFVQLRKIRDARNQLIKYSLAFRRLKRAFSLKAEVQQRDIQIQQATIILKNQDELKLCKTKEERDAIISSHVTRPQVEYSNLEKLADSVLLDVNIAISELQKCFDEYELTYNFQKSANMGYLLAQSTSKLNDMIQGKQ